MSFVLTTPGGGGAVSGLNTVSGIVIPAGSTTEIDQLDCGLYRGAEWILTLTNDNTGECMQQHVAMHINSSCTGITHTRYALIGILIPHSLAVDLIGSPPTGVSLEVTNPSGDDYIADFTRIDVFE